MKKEEFLKLLYAKLIERGVDKETAEKETSHVRTYLTESGTEELNVSLDEMADGIISTIEAGKGKKTEEKKLSFPTASKPKVKESVSDELGAAIAGIDDKPRRSPKTAQNQNEEKKPENKKASEKEKKSKEADDKQSGEEKRSLLYRMMEKVDKVIKDLQKKKADNAAKKESLAKEEKQPKAKKEKHPQKDNTVISEDSDIIDYVPREQKEKLQLDENGRMKNEWLYISILVVAIPIAIALILLSIVLYLGFWIVLALLMIACIAVLVAFVTVGSFVSIVGIVYGVVELITGNTPVGLFEIGLGVIVGSAVMFIGILVYNFAVRFIPFGMKLLAKLFRLGFRALRSGYNMLKGAVSNL